MMRAFTAALHFCSRRALRSMLKMLTPLKVNADRRIGEWFIMICLSLGAAHLMSEQHQEHKAFKDCRSRLRVREATMPVLTARPSISSATCAIFARSSSDHLAACFIE